MARHHHALHGGGGGYHHHHGGGGGWRGGYGPGWGWGPQMYAEPSVIVVPAMPAVTMAAPAVAVTPGSLAAAGTFFKTPLGLGTIALGLYLLLRNAD